MIKWLFVVLSLLFIPKSAIIIIILFSILYLADKVDNLDVVLTFFLIYFIQNGLGSLQGMVMIRYILIPVLLLKSFHNIIKEKSTYKHNIRYLLFFLIYLLINALFISTDTKYSFIEFILFLILLLFSFNGAKSIDNKDFEKKIINIKTLYIAVIFLSLIMMPIRSVAYARNGIGFQGVVVHPNALGVFLAPFCGYMFLRVLRNKNKWDIFLFIIAIILLFLSLSRTSFFSFLLGVCVYFVINNSFRARFSKMLLLFSLPLVIIFALNFSKISNSLSGFLIKSKGAESFTESVEQSRGKLFTAQLKNFEENPLFGIGFKVPSNKIAVTKTSTTDEIYYEKGNILLASLEELGIVGALLFLIALVSLLKSSKYVQNDFQILPIIATITALGEATLFSIGGLGIFIWVLIFLNKFNTNRKTRINKV
ncbi:O-antigen ligase [uncultured Chryseobacterium sp.]|uniref:O-antigen ligase family protein n=1 Tax=uncultured Chryseobacterium sp. TaxID=259322 RepID=UPI00262D1B95|nr:O-antigen ligase family protein [uncultured Chryseobacterium sp.]